MLAAMGAEARLRIVRLLLASHPTGMIAGDIAAELDIAPSTLSHHLERLKREEVITVRRDGTYLWYMANARALEDLLQFLYVECCTRSTVVSPARFFPSLPTQNDAGTRREKGADHGQSD
jgi:DNA-binding transcriptional ArsR family regulator